MCKRRPNSGVWFTSCMDKFVLLEYAPPACIIACSRKSARQFLMHFCGFLVLYNNKHCALPVESTLKVSWETIRSQSMLSNHESKFQLPRQGQVKSSRVNITLAYEEYLTKVKGFHDGSRLPSCSRCLAMTIRLHILDEIF